MQPILNNLFLAQAPHCELSGHDLAWWSIVPFACMLLAIAILPIVVPHWWEDNRHRGYIAATLGAPVAIWVGAHAPLTLLHTSQEYGAFVALLMSLYVIASGIVVRGTQVGTPAINTLILLCGGALASAIGTTGASMLLIRPLLQANQRRLMKAHVVVFFIFIVSNIGGLLTPLGDPPLFLGFLRGVPFAWTLTLWPAWAFALGFLLWIFYVIDTVIARRERPLLTSLPEGPPSVPWRLAGTFNFIFLAGIVALIVASGVYPLPTGTAPAGMLICAALSWRYTPAALRRENKFSLAPIIEVAVLFAGIFATMMPALALLNTHGARLSITTPTQFFWFTGLLSSFLDNAPTYLSFTALATALLHLDANALDQLLHSPAGESLLAAISQGAVMMGAMTYIGNGPNLMVKAVAESQGVRMPSFVGYMVYSVAILGPLFLIINVIFIG